MKLASQAWIPGSRDEACGQIDLGSDKSIEDTVTINADSLAKTMEQWKPLDVLYRANLVL